MTDVTAPQDWEQAVEAIDAWSLERRLMLTRHILDNLVGGSTAPSEDAGGRWSRSHGRGVGDMSGARRRQVVGPDPRTLHTPEELTRIMERATKRLQTVQPAPTDDEVRAILEEARSEKYR